MNALKRWIIQTVFLNTIIKNVVEILDYIGEKLGPNGKKTFYGVVVLVLLLAKQSCAECVVFIDPIYEQLNVTDGMLITATTLYTTVVGLGHKAVKGISGVLESLEKAEPKQ